MIRKSPSQIRKEAARIASMWAADRALAGDPEGSREMYSIANDIRRIHLTEQSK